MKPEVAGLDAEPTSMRSCAISGIRGGGVLQGTGGCVADGSSCGNFFDKKGTILSPITLSRLKFNTASTEDNHRGCTMSVPWHGLGRRLLPRRRNPLGLAWGLARRYRCRQPANVEYFRPVTFANWAAETPLRSNSAKIARRCSLETRTRPRASSVTSTFGAMGEPTESLIRSVS